ncbi:MAG TPA: AMP-binding protein [Candidatus Nanopelagicales bacterium]|nr:AMP-binding protein [Candidatus Nanopelagicales bacterium]
MVDDIPAVRNVAELVRRAMLARPDHPALRYEEQTLRWRELDAAVDAFASGSIRHGLVPGDRVALALGNGPAFVASYFGALRAGLVVVPLNTSYTTPELAGILAAAGPGLVVAEPATVDAVRAATEVPVMVAGQASYDSLVHAGTRADAPPAPDPATFDPELLAVLLFTAGTAGPPKGAMLSHRALLANIQQLRRLDPPAMRPDDVVLLVLPLFHVYALNAALGLAASLGATSVLADRFDPKGTLDLIAATGVTNVPGAPPMYVAWSREPRLAEALEGVRTLVSGAAPLAPGVLALITERTGKPVWEGYGMTEAAPVVATTLATGRPTPGSVGAPVPGLSVRIMDDDGEVADDGDPGEIELRGPSLFSGYWPDGADGPGPDGWWATGDIAYADEDGDLHLVDRRRDLVLVSGFNVYPFEVETALASHPEVAEAAVIGVPDERTGSAVKAFVVPLPGHQLTADRVLAHAATRLARFKCPTQLEIVESLPHSSTGKISRALLRDGWVDD